MAQATNFQLHDNSLISHKQREQLAESETVQSNSFRLGVTKLPTQAENRYLVLYRFQLQQVLQLQH